MRKLTFRETLLLHAKMLDEGIIPFTRDLQQPTAYFDTIPKEEAEAIKRRFRKLFRRALRNKARHQQRDGLDPDYIEWWQSLYGFGLTKKGLTPRLMKNRRSAVRTLLTLDVLASQALLRRGTPREPVCIK